MNLQGESEAEESNVCFGQKITYKTHTLHNAWQ